MTAATATGALRPYNAKWKTDVQYVEFECVKCGETAVNSYCEPSRTQMAERRLCFHCNFWREQADRIRRDHRHMTIIGGHIYGPGNATTGLFRGMAGRRFDIEYIEPSAYAGKRITTFDLWSGSAMPDELKADFPDTARFLGDAQKHQVGETTCWNPSDSRDEPYPLPRTLGGLL